MTPAEQAAGRIREFIEEKRKGLEGTSSRGEWERGADYFRETGPGECEITERGEFAILARVFLPRMGEPGFGEGRKNASFIASSRQDVPVMLTMLEKALESWVNENGSGGCYGEKEHNCETRFASDAMLIALASALPTVEEGKK